MLRQHHLLVFDGSLFGRLGCFGGRARPLVVRTDGFELDDGLAFEPADPAALHGAPWNSYADHRMATTGALVGLAVPGIALDDIGTTAKTLPEFPELWAAMLRDPAATSWIEL